MDASHPMCLPAHGLVYRWDDLDLIGFHLTSAAMNVSDIKYRFKEL
jgi:hypothetical protein